MDIRGEHVLPAATGTVWEALNDPEVLAATLPGCKSLERRDAHHFDAEVVTRVGPLSANFRIDVRIDELDPPYAYRISGNGKAGPAGFARGSTRVRLVEEGETTRLSYVADVEVGGKLAQLGSRLVQGAARQTAQQFFSNFAARLETRPAAADARTAAFATAPVWRRAWPLLLAVALCAVLLAFWLL